MESKIFRIKHADSENISSILHKLIATGSPPEMRKIRDKLRGEDGAQSKISPPNIADGKGDAQEFKFSGSVAVEHDKYSNSIIVCGTRRDMAHVEKIISGLDVLLEQVRIEVVIAQVTLANNETSGLESLGISYNTPLNPVGNPVPSGDKRMNFAGQGASSNGIEGGFSFGGTLHKFSLGYVFNRAKSHGNIKVLSAPTIVTTHNREASIKVGESRPVITANFTDLTNQKSIRNTINYKAIGRELTVTPLIGPNGVIQMKIDELIQKISGDVAIDGNNQPIITKRQAVSFVSVQDGDTVVLAGL
jgi:general secretion pathway protein D